MLKDCDWSLDRDYRTRTENEPLQFYLDGLSNSSEFYLLLGYFSSAAINLLSVGFATFISNGGKLKMVINHLLAEKDKEMIEKGQNDEYKNKVFDITDIVSLSKVLDEYDTHFFECIAYLIAKKRIEIKIIRPKGSNGISHYKSGVFIDGENRVSYTASCNFTLYGLSENLEKLQAFLSWEDERSNRLVEKELVTIKNYFEEKDENVEYLSINEIEIAIKDKFGQKDINELIIQEEDLLKKKSELVNNYKIKKTINRLHKNIDKIIRTPKFPYKDGPREYQIEAYNNWLENNYKGIFAMATGTGKTITSLNCLLNEYNNAKSYKALIIVPTIALAGQWKRECEKFNFKNIITVSSKSNWNDTLAFFNTASKIYEASYIIIVTYASFSRSKFQSYLKQFPEETILIADEVHNIGSLSIKKILHNIHLEKRIGLSATPYRKYDEEGNDVIEDFFKDSPPYIVSFSMKQALQVGWLCPYKYYPHLVELNNEELERYIKISKQLLKYLDPETHNYKKVPEVETMLLARKRIIHKAGNKLNVFRDILRKEFIQRGNLKYSLIYVPEGIEPDYSTNDINLIGEEDSKIINEYTKAVSDIDDSIMVKQFTSESVNREDILSEYEQGNIHVLTSMKCLDEGVDVPRSELAVFCASTGNPRQFIQRRGRVLRLAKGKIYATIHDLVVIPKIDFEDENYEMERNLVKKELERVVDFSSLAMNKMDTYRELEKVLEHYALNLYDFENNF